MLHWMCGKTIHDIIRNENIIESVRVTNIVQKMVTNRLIRWFRHVKKRPMNSVVNRIDHMEINQTTIGRRISRKCSPK